MGGSLAFPISLLLFFLPSFHKCSSDLSEPCPLDQSCVIFAFENADDLSNSNYQIHADAQKIKPNMKFFRLHVKPISEKTWALSATTNIDSYNGLQEFENFLETKFNWNRTGQVVQRSVTNANTKSAEVTALTAKNLIDIFTKEIVESLGQSDEEKSILSKFWSYTRVLLDGCNPTEVHDQCTSTDCDKLIITPNQVTCAQKGLKLVVSDSRIAGITQLKCASKLWKYSLIDGTVAELKVSNFVRCSAKDPSSAEPQTESKKGLYIGCGVTALFILLILAGGAFVYLQRRKSGEKICPERSTTEGESTVLGVTIDPTKAETKSWRWSDAPSVPSNKDNQAAKPATTLSDKGTLSPPDPAAQADQGPKKDTTFINVTESSTIATQSGTEKSKKK